MFACADAVMGEKIMKNNFVALKDSKYGEGIVVDVYNGTISIVNARQDDGSVYMQWCYPQRGGKGDNHPLETAVPWKLTLGDSADAAVKMLGRLAKIIEDLSDGEENPF